MTAHNDLFTRDDLLAAAAGVARHDHLEKWGRAVLDALHSLIFTRTHSSPGGLMHTLESTAELLHARVSPFDGMMEAPPEVGRLYGAHRLAFDDLREHRDRVLGRLLDELAGLVLNHELGEVLWSDLVALGATAERPPAPQYDDDWDF